MPAKSSQTKPRTTKPLVPKRASAVAAVRSKAPPPIKSVTKAAKVFKNFTASRFTHGTTAPNFVPKSDVGTPTAVQKFQRKSITEQLNAPTSSSSSDAGMTLALPKATIKRLLPTYSEKTGTIDLTDLLTLMMKKMSGTEFYANGNPTFNRLALQTQVDQIIQTIKKGK